MLAWLVSRKLAWKPEDRGTPGCSESLWIGRKTWERGRAKSLRWEGVGFVGRGSGVFLRVRNLLGK